MKRLLILLVLSTLACGIFNPPTLPPTPQTASVTPAVVTPEGITPSPTNSGNVPVTETTTPVVPVNFPDPNNYQWAQIVSGLNHPVDIQNAKDGSGRLFIMEQPGRIRIIQNGQLLDTPFLDITDRVYSVGSEQGLLGLAFDPNYQQNGTFYVNYTGSGGSHDIIARFRVTADPNVADPASGTILISIQDPFPNHNGGVLAFGPDGYLYAGFGDGGSAGDPFGNGQSVDTLLGKILRIDVSHGDPYSIPPDNPFVGGGGKPEIWAYGLRNPWRFSFDRATGDLYIGDVGQDKWEEIDYVPQNGYPGRKNFGWNIFEGTHPYSGAPASEPIISPIFEYGHDQGCAVTGGYVYRGAMPEWQGIYLFGDYCSGNIWGLIHSNGGWQNQILFRSGFLISTFGVDESNELYLANLSGSIYRLVHR